MSTNKSDDIDKVSCVVVYDRETGEILHKHEHVTLRGGRHPDKKVLEKDALEHASGVGRTAARASVLHVDAETLDASKHYRVDTQRQALVEVPRPATRTTRKTE
jgi:hypothetical protein